MAGKNLVSAYCSAVECPKLLGKLQHTNAITFAIKYGKYWWEKGDDCPKDTPTGCLQWEIDQFFQTFAEEQKNLVMFIL